MRLVISQLLRADKLPRPKADQGSLDTIFSIVFVALGAIAILLLIIAGLRYITARGEPDKMAAAKNMIVYTLIGLIITALAATIVNYVLGRV